MTRNDEQPSADGPQPSPADAARQHRLAAALRENLKRRKSQARERRDADHPPDDVT